MLFCSLLTFAQFSGSGSGTENDPYLILNPIQLNQMRNFLNKEGVYFKMMADIDLTEFIEDEYPSQGWLPIGSTSSPFKGVLDGNGNTITGLWINRPETDYVGLFGSSSCSILNLSLKDISIQGHDYVGGFCGGSSSFNNCHISGLVSGNSYVGGFCSYGGFIGCTSQVEISATGNYVGGFCGTSELSFTNCILSSKEIRGVNYVGGLCGQGKSKAKERGWSNCIVQANIIATGYMVGGLCGAISHDWGGYWDSYEGSNVVNCGFIGTISADSSVGGICGSYAGQAKMSACFAIGDIKANGDYVGGLVGSTGAYGPYADYVTCPSISECYYQGKVVGRDNIGGVIGSLGAGSLFKCYSNASILGNSNVGGVCGILNGDKHHKAILNSNVNISNTINASGDNVGRVYGKKGTFTEIGNMGSNSENKSLNRTVITIAGVAQEITDDEQNGTGVSATTLKLKATYVAMGWDFTDTWEIQETECYPYFKTQTAPPVITSDVVSGTTTVSGKCVSGANVVLDIDGVKQEKVFEGTSFSFTVEPLQAGHEVRVSAKADGKEQSYFATAVVSYLGKGTEDDPYQISTAADLTCAYRKGYYKLMNDLDLTNYINQYSPTGGWESIGREGSETIYFDGDGHKVTGLWCNSTRDNTGLFSCFANGYLKNLTVETASGKEVKGGSNTGILIGKMINGTIENCHVSGNVADGTPVGGIVGLLDGGKILLSKASVTINTTGDNTYVGGLVGDITSGEIDQCVTLGTITATGKNSQAGGLVGKNAATVTNCYCNVAVTSAYCAAGLVSYNYGLVEKSYATGNLSSQNYGAGVIGYNDGENAIIRNCVAMNQRIDVTFESQSAQSGGYGQRVLGGYKNGAPDPEMNNYALKTMQLSVNDIPQKVYNDIMNGTAMSGDELMTASTYQTLGWDFTENWSIAEGESYPSLKNNVAEVKAPEKIVLKVTPPTAITGLVYSGKKQSLIEAGSTTIGNMVYSPDGYGYSKDIPTGIDAMEYTVYYRVLDDTFLTDPETIKVTISAKTVNSPTITLSETSYTYDGNAKEPTVTVKDGETTISASEYTVSYSNNSNVGTATVTITDKEGGNYTVSGSTTFTISSADGSMTPPTEKSGLVYTGSAQDLITAGSSTTGTIQYSLNGTNYSTSIPQGTDAKEYTVYYKVVADAGYNDVDPASFKVTIAAKMVSSPTITLSKTSYTYDGNAKEPTVTVKDGETTIPSSEYTVSYANNTNVGTATVTITDKEGGNYIVSGSATFSITGAEPISGTTPITIGKSGKASYCGDKSLDFSYSDEIKAYIATGFDKDEEIIWLTRVKDVPAGVPVLIKGKANETYQVPVTDSQNSYYKNMFKGNTSGNKIQVNETEANLVNYYLSGDGTFKSVKGYVNIDNNKCYLQLPGTFNPAVAGATQTVTVGASGKASYAAPVDLDFTNVEGLKAFSATGYDKSSKTIWLTRVMKVQKGEGILLKGDAKDYQIPSTSVQSSYMNMFVGNTSGVKKQVQETSEDGSQTNFYLNGDGSFVSVNGYVNISNNKCYLELPTSMVAVAASTRGTEANYLMEEPEIIKMPVFRSIDNDGDGTTGIKDQSSKFNAQLDAYYTLQGQRVAKPGKGLYIKNGKKVVIK